MTDPTPPIPSPPPTPSIPSTNSSPSPVGTSTGHQIRTDRPCACCGFNLFGQTIVREPHYGLIAARCPECGQLAALQEYPALGKWADRWAKALAALWIWFLLTMLAAHLGPMLGFSYSILETSSFNLGSTIAHRYNESLQTGQGPPTQQQTYTGSGAFTPVDLDWWRDNRVEVVAAHRASSSPSARESASLWVLLAVGALFNGVFWSVCLLGTRRHIAILIALIPTAGAVALVWGSRPAMNWGGPNTIIAHEAAREVLKPDIMPPILITLLAGTALGIWQGRRIARAFVRVSLPPRMRSALAILWTRDGLSMPGRKQT